MAMVRYPIASVASREFPRKISPVSAVPIARVPNAMGIVVTPMRLAPRRRSLRIVSLSSMATALAIEVKSAVAKETVMSPWGVMKRRNAWS